MMYLSKLFNFYMKKDDLGYMQVDTEKESLSGVEIRILLDCGDCEVERTYDELANHGWIRVALIFSIDRQNYYKCTAYYHDDYGYDWEDIEDQICPQVVLKKVLVDQWVEVKL